MSATTARGAVPVAPGPGPVSVAATVGAFLRRDWATARSYRLSFVMAFAQPLFSLVLIFYLGHLVNRTKLVRLGGVESGYFAFAALGVALISIAQAGLSSFSDKMRVEQTSGTMEALLATPASPSLVILSSAAYDFAEATLRAFVLVDLAVILGFRPAVSLTSLLGAFLALIFAIILCASVGVVLSAFTIVFKKTGPLVGLLTTALVLLGGVYFPVKLLPVPLRQLGEALPFTWALDLLRQALLRGSFSLERVGLLLASSALALPIALGLFGGALKRVRRTGTLTHY